MLRSSLFDYSNAYIIEKGTKSLTSTVVAAVAPNNANKTVLFKNCSLFITCISRLNNTQANDA